MRRKILRSRIGFAMLVIPLLASQAAQALIRDWDRPNGVSGSYTSDLNWSPTGVPRAEDSVRFNVSNIDPTTVLFTQDKSATDVLVDVGDVRFAGTSTRTYSVDALSIASFADLTLQNAFGEFPDRFYLDVANDVTVTGDLKIFDGARLTSNDVYVDSSNGGNSATFRLSGSNSDGEVSSAEVANLRIGFHHSGDILVEEGAVLEVDTFTIFDGEVVIMGSDASGNPSTIISADQPTIGLARTGSLKVLAGGRLASPGGSLGFIAPATGSVLLDGKDPAGNPSRWDASGPFTIYRGALTVSGGAMLTTERADLSGGQHVIEGLGSSWTTGDLIDIDTSTVRVTNGALISSFETNIELSSQLLLEGGTNANVVATWKATNNAYVGGTEFGSAIGGSKLELSGYALADVGGTLKIWDHGEVKLGNSSKLTANRIENSLGGDFWFIGGTLEVNQFDGDLENQGGTLAPGGLEAGGTTLFGDYSQLAGGTLSLDIGGTSPVGTYDVVTVAGGAQIDGRLDLSLINGFRPNASDVLTMFSANSLFGFFDNVNTGDRLDTSDGGGSFVVNYGVGSTFDPNQIVLSDFVPTPSPGDFDADGDIDGQDFLAWQRGESPDPTSLLDRVIWRFNYLGTLTPGVAARAIPEPSTILLTGIGAIALIGCRCRYAHHH